MGRIQITDIERGDAGTIGAPNALLAEWATESANIDAENIAPGGLDRRNLDANVANGEMSAPSEVFQNDTTIYNVTTTTSPVTFGGIAAEIGPFIIDTTNDREWLIHVSAEISVPSGMLIFELHMADDGPVGTGTFVLLPYTTRRDVIGGGWHSAGMTYRLVEPVASLTTWFALYAYDTAAVSKIRNVDIYAEELVR